MEAINTIGMVTTTVTLTELERDALLGLLVSYIECQEPPAAGARDVVAEPDVEYVGLLRHIVRKLE